MRELVIQGWASNNIGRLVIKGAANGPLVEFDADGCRMAAAFDHLRVDGVTAYRDESRGGT